jgi:hypothetical protein
VADSVDEPTPVDGYVGRVEGSEESPWSDSFLWVSVHGDISASAAPGMAEDLRRLIHAFIQHPDSLGREKTLVGESPRLGQDGEIQLALHGFELDGDVEAELRRLIHEFVRQRLAHGETAE